MKAHILSPMPCPMHLLLQAVSIKTELNYMSPNWCPESWRVGWCGRDPLHISAENIVIETDLCLHLGGHQNVKFGKTDMQDLCPFYWRTSFKLVSNNTFVTFIEHGCLTS